MLKPTLGDGRLCPAELRREVRHDTNEPRGELHSKIPSAIVNLSSTYYPGNGCRH
jgi:hypothetical protein